MMDRLQCFGPFTLDRRAGELRRDGTKVDLMPKMFALLAYFLDHPGRLILKEELLDTLWRDTHVAEGSVTRTVANLREALGDRADEPLYIETVTRRGYRFMAAVEETSVSPYALVHEHRVYPLRKGDNLLGRAEESVVPIVSPLVSRRHAIVCVTAGGATLHDLGSKNRTSIGNVQVAEPVPLHDGDEIRLGPLTFTFVTRGRTASTITDGLV